MEDAVQKFDAVVESCREGIRKPNPEIYKVCSYLAIGEVEFLDNFN